MYKTLPDPLLDLDGVVISGSNNKKKVFIEC